NFQDCAILIVRLIYQLIMIPAGICLVGIFFSCANDLEKVKRVTHNPDSPEETSEDFHIVFTDSGFAKIEIFAGITETYAEPVRVTKFKNGLRVNFFDANGEIASVLTSKYGEIEDDSGDIVVRDSVELFNVEKERTLKTEVLYWNKKSDSIYTDKDVRIISPDMILDGVGAWTTPLFDTAHFYKPKAEVYLKE
ncbi:MAG: LPS export ABC transporter periplasmic protein LptC, partial [Crocinitomicaceae bacterium]|nr:LPS export ABC transporter periplasmic protein LptC [Crocinitomicaceae bacterium]